MSTIAEKLTRLATYKEEIKTAINGKGGSVGNDMSEYSDAISNLSTGGSFEPRTSWYVWFIDYDGTEISFQEVPDGGTITYPSAPDRTSEGLVFTGWNETNTVANSTNFYDDGLYRMIVIGAIYDTIDGNTKIYIHPTKRNTYFSVTIQPTVDTGCIIDWGDGVLTSTDRTSMYYYGHTYSTDYVTNNPVIVSIECTSGTYSLGSTSSIGSGFSGSKISKLFIGNKCTSFGKNLLFGYNLESISISNSVTSIGESCFSNCRTISNINIPRSVKSIGNYAFSGSSALQSISIPSSVTIVGSRPFSSGYFNIFSSIINKFGDDNLLVKNLSSYNIYLNNITLNTNKCPRNSLVTKVEIPNNISSISSYAFNNCTSLKEVTIPNSVTSIVDYAFYNCGSLQKVTIPSYVTLLGNYVFSTCINLKEVTIPNSVTNIGSSCFNECCSLKEVTIPDSVTNIGSICFKDCYSLKEVTIPNSVTKIGSYLFSNCHSLKEVTIPNSVTSLENYCFQYCYNLKKIDFGRTRTTIPTLASTYCFDNTNCSIVVPDALYDNWIKATNWSSTTIKANIIKYSQYYCYEVIQVNPTILTENIYGNIGSIQLSLNLVCRGKEGDIVSYDLTSPITVDIDDNTTGSDITVTKTFEYNGCEYQITYTQTSEIIIQTVTLNSGDWIESTKTIDGYTVMMSNSNKGVSNSTSWIKVETNNVTNLELYINSYAELDCDYTVAQNIDVDKNCGVMTTTKSSGNSNPTSISNFTKVTYTNDSNYHYVWICYRKDSSVNNYDDCGYLAIPNKYTINIV